MEKYIRVNVASLLDENGDRIPTHIVWKDSCKFPIERIIHVCQPEDLVVRYTILIGGKQRQLYSNGNDWRISAPQ